MDHQHHHATNTTALAANATLHCLTGCAIGEVSGMVIGMALGLSTLLTVILAIALAFVFGFTLSTLPLLKQSVPFGAALSVVAAADTLSIAVMEVVDNLVMVVIPGAMDSGLANPLFWLALLLSLAAAFVAAFPVNKYLLTKGKGHALLMKYHQHPQHLE